MYCCNCSIVIGSNAYVPIGDVWLQWSEPTASKSEGIFPLAKTLIINLKTGLFVSTNWKNLVPGICLLSYQSGLITIVGLPDTVIFINLLAFRFI